MKVARHIIDARREAIAQMLSNDGYIPVAEVCKHFNVSEATARRDLSVLESQHRLTRTHGGALTDNNHSKVPMGELANSEVADCLSRLGAKAAIKIKAGTTIYLDSGLVVYFVAQSVVATKIPHLQVVTPSVTIAQLLATLPGVKIHLLGGDFMVQTASVSGVTTMENVSRWKFDLSILNADAIDENGLWHSQREIADLQREVLGRTQETLLCLSKLKLGRRESFAVQAIIDKCFLVIDADATHVAKCKVKIPGSRIVSA